MIGYRATIDSVRHQVTLCTPKRDRFHFVRGQGCGFVPLSAGVCRQVELNFLLSACLIDEDSVVSVVLPPVVCRYFDIFFIVRGVGPIDWITTLIFDHRNKRVIKCFFIIVLRYCDYLSIF